MTASPQPPRAGAAAAPALPRSPAPAIVPLGPDHVPDAAALFAASYARLRASVPALPIAYENPQAIRPRLERIRSVAVEAGVPGVAAIRDGRLTGYLLGRPIPGLRTAGFAARVPEWAHAVEGPERASTWSAMYAAVAGQWVGRGWLTHCVSLLAGDEELAGELAWLGFGAFVVDAVRGLEGGGEAVPFSAAVADPEAASDPTAPAVERATAADVEELAALDAKLEAHYATAPTFLYHEPADSTAAVHAVLDDPDGSIWLERRDARVVSSIYLARPGLGTAAIVDDPGTIGICGAVTSPAARGSGAATRVLRAAVDAARREGFVRMSVDFESANLDARRFWMRHFEPVCVSYERHVDERFARAQAGAVR